MKKKINLLFLLDTAVFLGIFALICMAGTEAFSFPFAQIGSGLRLLSLSGNGGNVAAITLYCIVCLMPMGYLLVRRNRLAAEDGLLVLLTALLFGVMYLMVNPGLLENYLGKAGAGTMGKGLLSLAVWSVVIAYAVLRLLRWVKGAGNEQLFFALELLLIGFAAGFMLLGLGIGLRELLEQLGQLREENTAPGVDLMPTNLFLLIRFGMRALEYTMDTVVSLCLAKLVHALRVNGYSQAAVDAARRSKVWASRALALVTLAAAAVNLAQLVFARQLQDVSLQLRIPVVSAALVLTALVASELIRQGKALRDDNDAFI